MEIASQFALYEQAGFVARIEIRNPPVNALSQGVRVGLAAAIARAHGNPAIKVVLIVSSGNLFSAGADIKEFDGPMAEPTLQQLQAMIESSSLPMVAAIHGLALGGGLELAMACHYRLAHKDARLGLPEITLGLIPGAGGTQRLPRLIGADAALHMILAGTPISSVTAKERGLVDEVVDGELPTAAIDFCERLVREGRGPRRTCDRILGTGLTEGQIANAFHAHARALKGRTTHHLVVQAIKASTLPFAEGLAVEAELAKISLASDESRALRHIFFAERKTRKIPGTNRVEGPPLNSAAKPEE